MTLAPILGLCLFLGIYPQPVIATAERDLGIIAGIVEKRSEVARGPQPGAADQHAQASAMQPRAGED